MLRIQCSFRQLPRSCQAMREEPSVKADQFGARKPAAEVLHHNRPDITEIADNQNAHFSALDRIVTMSSTEPCRCSRDLPADACRAACPSLARSQRGGIPRA